MNHWARERVNGSSIYDIIFYLNKQQPNVIDMNSWSYLKELYRLSLPTHFLQELFIDDVVVSAF